MTRLRKKTGTTGLILALVAGPLLSLANAADAQPYRRDHDDRRRDWRQDRDWRHERDRRRYNKPLARSYRYYPVYPPVYAPPVAPPPYYYDYDYYSSPGFQLVVPLNIH